MTPDQVIAGGDYVMSRGKIALRMTQQSRIANLPVACYSGSTIDYMVHTALDSQA